MGEGLLFLKVLFPFTEQTGVVEWAVDTSVIYSNESNSEIYQWKSSYQINLHRLQFCKDKGADFRESNNNHHCHR